MFVCLSPTRLRLLFESIGKLGDTLVPMKSNLSHLRHLSILTFIVVPPIAFFCHFSCKPGYKATRDLKSLLLDCSPCPQDTIFPTMWDSESCISCPQHTTTHGSLAQTDFRMCHPIPGYYRKVNSSWTQSKVSPQYTCKINARIVKRANHQTVKTQRWDKKACEQECSANTLCTGYVFDSHSTLAYKPLLYDCTLIIMGEPTFASKNDDDQWGPSTKTSEVCLLQPEYIQHMLFSKYQIQVRANVLV